MYSGERQTVRQTDRQTNRQTDRQRAGVVTDYSVCDLVVLGQQLTLLLAKPLEGLLENDK